LAKIFLGPAIRRDGGIRFLWSLGYGDGARGFGKTSYLQWFTRSIRADNGAELLELCGGDPHECVCVAYCSFSTLENLSLSNVLFDACNDIVLRHSAALENLKARFSGTNEQLLVAASEMAQYADAGYRDDFLWRLVHRERAGWQWYLGHRMRPWHQMRWGRELFASIFSLLRALGMSRFVLCVDQVEDFRELGYAQLQACA